MLADPEEGHYSNENKAGRAFRRALFTLGRARRYSHLLRTDREDCLNLYTQSSNSQVPELRLQTWGSRPETSPSYPPLTAAQCWADAGTGGGDGGGCLVRRQSCVSVLASVWETPRHGFMRCSRGAFIRWRQRHSLGIHALKIYQGNRDAVVWGHRVERESTHKSAGWFMRCTL